MNEIQQILFDATIDGNTVKLNCGQLEKNLYAKVNNVLTRLWGKWNGRKKSHVFNFDPTDLINNYIDTGILPPKNEFAYFPTPQIVLDDIKQTIRWCSKVLEPSAGQGAIAKIILEDHPKAEVDCIEISEVNYEILKRKGFNVIHSDFLCVQPEPIYDTVVMNPPFSVKGDKTAYMTHIYHAFEFLKSSGQLFCITPNFTNKTDKRTQQFKDFISKHLKFSVSYEKGIFKDSGTMIETDLYCLDKTAFEKDFFLDRFYWIISGNYEYAISYQANKDKKDDEYIDYVINYFWNNYKSEFPVSEYREEYKEILKRYKIEIGC